MNQSSSGKILSIIIPVLVLLATIKLALVIVSYLYLPEKGIALESGQVKSSLYYRYRFASDVALPNVTSPKKPTVIEPSIKDIRLVGIYSGKTNCIVTLLKKGKSHVLSKGENIDGFILKGASAREAYFEKNDKRYTLKLFDEKKKSNSSISIVDKEISSKQVESKPDGRISKKDGIRQVPRSILKTYTSDISKAMRDIGLRPIRKGNQMQGYKVRFIRKGSPFSELGLERGDIIKAINGEDIVDLTGPMALLKSADSIEGLTITVIRKNEEKELEYEVK